MNATPAAGPGTCPGHVGRGTGENCAACHLPVPAHLRRTCRFAAGVFRGLP